jgi:hypothetical protein
VDVGNSENSREEVNRRISQTMTGRKLSLQHRARISEGRRRSQFVGEVLLASGETRFVGGDHAWRAHIERKLASHDQRMNSIEDRLRRLETRS